MPKKLLFYSIISGILLSLPWYPAFPGIILSVALLPLLFIDDLIYNNKKHYSSRLIFLYATLTFLVWNLLTLWYIAKVTLAGALFIICFNTLLYSFIFWLAHLIKRKTQKSLGQFALVIFWIALEYINLNNELSIPWLNLGNGFAHNIKIIQWYEYTGVLGGSVWVLIANIIIFNYLKPKKIEKFKIVRIELFIFLAWILLPVIFSSKIYKNPDETSTPVNIAIIQPNIDPYLEKFNALSQDQQLDIILQLADSVGTDSTDYFIAPETAIDNDIWEDAPQNNFSLYRIREFNNTHPESAFIIGAITYKEYRNDADKSPTVRFEKDDSIYYDAFNSVIQLDTSFNTQFYHKSKLVIGVEKTPLLWFFKYFDKLMFNLGGITGSLGQDSNQNILYSKDSIYRVTPLICYESIFGEYVHENVQKGANLIFAITNDGWWDGTPGYMQHFNLSRLRAIETRRWIARSANTGISGIINTRGDIVQSTQWWKRTALTGKIYTQTKQTFYIQNGDYLGRVAVFFSICIVMIYIFIVIKNKKEK